MEKQDTQKPRKLSLKRETVRLLSGAGAEQKDRKEITTPRCTEFGPNCEP
ncbi:hypothetical protein ASNO1_01480 [Corallococcus caeni]|uniref:Uncharacterized protein n=1 Tax=Corallococcus caeni TaxID=3082388 RepID=A0ABQ6QIK0_9BACT|nr:hypothetical protein ASNO1_01480 [Corallococcus sp. NO1]